ncbi:MAG: serine hydrolase [Chloroflexi bacterium]|nr:serine hydrolase [Chloroflexota bacterium]
MEQARRLVSPKKPARRYVGPALVVVLSGLMLGLVLFWLTAPAQPVPTPPRAGTVVAGPAVGQPAASVPAQEAEATLAPAAPTPDPHAVAQQRLREAVFAPFRSVSGRFGIAVKDLGTGYSVYLNENYPFQAASLYKLPVMYEVFKQRDAGLFTLSEEMTIGPDDVAMDLGSLPWPAGTRITIGTALERMVTISDNSGAYMLSKRVGSPQTNEDMLALGLGLTHVRGDDLQTSAGDMARLLETIARGQAVSSSTSAEMVHLMARQQVRNRIPVLMPPEATVANKTGNWEGAAHDVAIVYGPRSTFVIALLSDGITDFDGLYDAMAHAARAVYDLTNDSSFGTSADPALPPNEIGSYAAPPKVPAAPVVTVAPRLTTPASGPSTTAPPANVVPASKPAPPASAPSDSTRGPQPAVQPTPAGTAAPAGVTPTTAPGGAGQPGNHPGSQPGNQSGSQPGNQSGNQPAPKPGTGERRQPTPAPTATTPAQPGQQAPRPAIKPSTPALFGPQSGAAAPPAGQPAPGPAAPPAPPGPAPAAKPQ